MAIPLRALRLLPSTLFIAAFLVMLVTTNVRLAFNSLELYEWEFARQGVPRVTGLTLEQLSDAGGQIRDYFNSATEPLDARVTVDGKSVPLFTEREVLHMADVKQLVQRVYRLQEGCLLFLFLWITLGFFIQGSDFIPRMQRLLLQASVLAMVIVGVAGFAAMVAFQPLFLLFHRFSFANNLWILDPETSFLLRMFPQQFWVEATVLIGASTIAEALAMALLLTTIGWWRQRQIRAAQRKTPQFT
jgi:integral membrane protein (TIGR01906 family)